MSIGLSTGHTFHVQFRRHAVFAAGVTLYYWWENTKGIEESSDKALKVMKITTVMVVILLSGGCYTLLAADTCTPSSPCPPSEPALQRRRARLSAASGLAAAHASFGLLRHHDRLRPLRAGHERRRIPGPGQPRDRASQAAQPEEAPPSSSPSSASSSPASAPLLAVMLIPDDVRMPL